MTRTLRRMIGNPRTLADIMQNTSQQQRLIMPIIITVSTRCFTTKPRDHLNRMTVNRIPMRSRSTRAITNRQPFRNQPTRNIDKINLLPHLQQRGTARKQTQEQTTRLIIPRAIIDRTRLQILQRAGRDRQTKLSRSNSSPQRKTRIGLRIGTRRKHDLLLMLGDTGRDHIKRSA